MKNQNLLDLLSKVSLITTSIEDHVNRRFNRILINNNSSMFSSVGTTAAASANGNGSGGGSCSISPKNSNSSSAESGLTGSDIVINDVDSNDDDLSDDGLDYSQKFADNQNSNANNNEPSDEAFIGKYIEIL